MGVVGGCQQRRQQYSGEECRGKVGGKKEAQPQLMEWMLRGSGRRGMGRE